MRPDEKTRCGERLREARVKLSEHEVRALERCLSFEDGVDAQEAAVRIFLLRADPLSGPSPQLRLTAVADPHRGLTLELSREEGASVWSRCAEPLPPAVNRVALRPHVLRELFPELPRQGLGAWVWSGRRVTYAHRRGWELALDVELALSVTGSTPDTAGLGSGDLGGATVQGSGLLRWRTGAAPAWLEQVVAAASPLDLRGEARRAVRAARQLAKRREAEERLMESWFQ